MPMGPATASSAADSCNGGTSLGRTTGNMLVNPMPSTRNHVSFIPSSPSANGSSMVSSKPACASSTLQVWTFTPLR